MALREFTDGEGTVWRVWDTRPMTGRVREEFQRGWLTFVTLEVSGHESSRRRVAPIPDRWETLPAHELRRLGLQAPVERLRTRGVE